jgi:hypothetical protein
VLWERGCLSQSHSPLMLWFLHFSCSQEAIDSSSLSYILNIYMFSF